MSSNPCDLVAERVALGEPLGDVAEHAASCPRCRAIAALPTEIGAVHREADPGIGFTARMTAGAQHRFAARRRRRIAAGMATAVAATTLGVFVMTRSQTAAIEPPIPPTAPATATNPPNDPWNPDQERPSTDDDDDLASLVYFADTDRAAAQTANWKEIAKPLRPYRAVVEGVEP